jgi:hypothetical protein
MTLVTVNNKSINESLILNKQTLKELMDTILLKVATEKEVITHIEIDNKELSIEKEKHILKDTYVQYKTVNFTLRSSIELAFEALDTCSEYIDIALNKIKILSALYHQNKIEEANAKFIEVVEVMDIFVQLMSKIHNTLKIHFEPSFKKSETIQNLEIHLLSILKALIPAKEKEDIIMLCDLLEYELTDNITRWKIKAIPELRQLNAK